MKKTLIAAAIAATISSAASATTYNLSLNRVLDTTTSTVTWNDADGNPLFTIDADPHTPLLNGNFWYLERGCEVSSPNNNACIGSTVNPNDYASQESLGNDYIRTTSSRDYYNIGTASNPKWTYRDANTNNVILDERRSGGLLTNLGPITTPHVDIINSENTRIVREEAARIAIKTAYEATLPQTPIVGDVIGSSADNIATGQTEGRFSSMTNAPLYVDNVTDRGSFINSAVADAHAAGYTGVGTTVTAHPTEFGIINQVAPDAKKSVDIANLSGDLSDQATVSYTDSTVSYTFNDGTRRYNAINASATALVLDKFENLTQGELNTFVDNNHGAGELISISHALSPMGDLD